MENVTQKMPKHIAFYLNGQGIPGSFYGMILHRIFRGNEYDAGRIFYRARNKENPIEYISKGILRDNPFILKMTVEEEQAGNLTVQKWIDETIHKMTVKTTRPIKKIGKEGVREGLQKIMDKL